MREDRKTLKLIIVIICILVPALVAGLYILPEDIKELGLDTSFLPKQLNEEETKKICKETIESLGASSMKDMGKIMGHLKQKHGNSIDFSKVNLIVKELLNK